MTRQRGERRTLSKWVPKHQRAARVNWPTQTPGYQGIVLWEVSITSHTCHQLEPIPLLADSAGMVSNCPRVAAKTAPLQLRPGRHGVDGRPVHDRRAGAGGGSGRLLGGPDGGGSRPHARCLWPRRLQQQRRLLGRRRASGGGVLPGAAGLPRRAWRVASPPTGAAPAGGPVPELARRDEAGGAAAVVGPPTPPTVRPCGVRAPSLSSLVGAARLPRPPQSSRSGRAGSGFHARFR